MQDVINTINKEIKPESVTSNYDSFTELAKRWAVHSLETYREELLSKALKISVSLCDFDAELHGDVPSLPRGRNESWMRRKREK